MTLRRLILIDVENFNGDPVVTPAQARWCRRILDNWIQPGPCDIVVLAADVTTVTNVYARWPRHRILPGYGKTGPTFVSWTSWRKTFHPDSARWSLSQETGSSRKSLTACGAGAAHHRLLPYRGPLEAVEVRRNQHHHLHYHHN